MFLIVDNTLSIANICYTLSNTLVCKKGEDMRIIFMMTVVLSIVMAEPTMVKDPKNNLIWEDTLHASEVRVTQSEAESYCKTLTLGTFDNWRLPTLPELLSIVDYTHYKPAILKEFKHVENDTLYWSSTVYVRSAGDFWGVVFHDGSTKSSSEIYDRYVRCVRDAK